jgi:hypothetical protein
VTTAPTPDLRALAEAAEGNGEHIYTHPRDSNKWRENEAWHRAASPGTVLHLLDRIHKLEMDALDLASENSILKRAETDELEARKPLPLSDEQIDAIADGMPGGLGGFMKTWGWRQFARKILELRAPPIWEPQFDAMAPGQEELAVQFCAEIAGPRGQPGRNPDPVRLLEMAQALYKAEADAHGITASPAPLIASREVVADGPVRVTRLHLTAGGRAGLTSKAAGPLPDITGGSS